MPFFFSSLALSWVNWLAFWGFDILRFEYYFLLFFPTQERLRIANTQIIEKQGRDHFGGRIFSNPFGT